MKTSGQVKQNTVPDKNRQPFKKAIPKTKKPVPRAKAAVTKKEDLENMEPHVILQSKAKQIGLGKPNSALAMLNKGNFTNFFRHYEILVLSNLS